MHAYPEVVGKIAADYLQRLRSQLAPVPAFEKDEFLREIESHIYEAYQQTQGDDEVARILAVLRKLGEPAEVVSDRLPAAMVRSGTRRNFPLYVLGGILIGLFGIPLGFGGVGVLAGLLCALLAIVATYYALAGTLLLFGAVCMLAGVTRFLVPELWDKLVLLGFIQVSGPPSEFFDHISSSDQGLILIVIAAVVGAAGLGMLRLGKHLLLGLRFLYNLSTEWVRRGFRTVRRNLRHKSSPSGVGEAAFVK